MESTQDAVFLIEGDTLVELTRTPYRLEDDFQAQLARHPQLLGGGQYPGISPRRWILIDREIPVPDKEEGSGRWSVDHLFVDQDAIPTLVEVKRATDTRLRRETIGQMLDYAANGSRYWPGELLRRRWEASLPPDMDAETKILSFAGSDADRFWNQVSENLEEGRVRMLFVSDEIPTELQTVIEYLNEQMDRAEVFGVSLSRYAGEGLSVLVPRVVGSSARAQQAKEASSGRTYHEYLAEVGEEAVQVEERLLRLADSNGLVTRRTPKALQLRTPSGDRDVLQFYPGFRTVQLTLDPLRHMGLKAVADEILEQARQVGGEGLTEKYPGIPLDDALGHWDLVEAMVLRLSSATDRRVLHGLE
jgi:hypothetical protein